MSPTATSGYGWNGLPWRKLRRAVFKLQTRIYQASRRGDVQAVRKLQRLLVTSRAAKLLATRRAAQDNRGKRTAGVDGVRSLTPPKRLALARSLTLRSRASPTRRVWIPKPGTDERRPLGIPTLRDRAEQTLLTLALEPDWEARFEPRSYGFRPGRAAHDAIQTIFNVISKQATFVLDADIAKCFDRIDHAALLQKLQTTPTFRRAVRAWLRAGVLDGPTLFPTEAGTPQGGPASPLLANIALHGLETAVSAAFPLRTQKDGVRVVARPHVVRYADDFVILHPDLAVVEQAQAVAAAWLAGIGLELKPSKTRLVHTLREHAGQPPGFDFLGFTVRQFPAGKTHSGKANGRTESGRKLLGFKTIIRPSTTAVKRHGEKLAELIRRDSGLGQEKLIADLNPVIAGWSNYYRTVCSADTFARLDHLLFLKLWRWAVKRHRQKGRRWVAKRYWHPERGAWRFATPDGKPLRTHRQTRIQRHVLVKADRSPYDGDWSYWATRQGRNPLLPRHVAWLLRQQQGRCAWCGLQFTLEDRWKVGTLATPASQGTGESEASKLFHERCHDDLKARATAQAAGVR
jgi:RNA-directed DNA polymerase